MDSEAFNLAFAKKDGQSYCGRCGLWTECQGLEGVEEWCGCTLAEIEEFMSQLLERWYETESE